MGVFSKVFGGYISCPKCGTAYAKDGFGGSKCRNRYCQLFSETFATSGVRNPVEIQYRNFRNEFVTFFAAADTLRKKRNHLIARVAPTGRKIALSLDRIRNHSALDEFCR